MKAAEWKGVAKRAVMGLSGDWVQFKRMIYRPTGRWIVQGVMADSTQWVSGQTLWRLCVVPLHDYDGLSLDWSVRLGIREDDTTSPDQLADEVAATLRGLPSEEEELCRVASSRKPAGRRANLTRACVHAILGDAAAFRELILAPSLVELTPNEAAIPGLAEQYEPHRQRVLELRSLADDVSAVVAQLDEWTRSSMTSMLEARALKDFTRDEPTG
jgi:hypothetical protein